MIAPPKRGMSKEMKVLAIVFGGAFGLLFLGIVVLVVMIPILGKVGNKGGGNEAKDNAAVAAKIATFTLPAGYEIADAQDFGITQTVTIVPKDRAKHGFQIQLTGQKLPSDSSVAKSTSDMTFGLVGKLVAKCDMSAQPDDVVEIRGKSVHLSVRGCNGVADSPRTEFGTFEAKDPSVIVSAIGIGPFDTDALHALLRSIK